MNGGSAQVKLKAISLIQGQIRAGFSMSDTEITFEGQEQQAKGNGSSAIPMARGKSRIGVIR